MLAAGLRRGMNPGLQNESKGNAVYYFYQHYTNTLLPELTLNAGIGYKLCIAESSIMNEN